MNFKYILKITSLLKPSGMALLVALFALLIGFQGKSQVSIDSLTTIFTNENNSDSLRFSAINTFYVNYSNSLPDSALLLSDYHFKLAHKSNSITEKSKALNEKALSFFILGNYEGSIKTLEKALEIRQEMNDSIGIASLYSNIGTIYRELEKYQEAVRYYTLSLGILNEKSTQFTNQADLLNNIGLIYRDIGMFDLALDYLNQALGVYQKEGVLEETGNIWLNIGAVYFEKGEISQSIQYYSKALKILQETNNRYSEGECYHQFSRLYQHNNQIDSALFFINKSLEINIAFENTELILIDNVLKAELLVNSDLQTATQLGESVLDQATKIANKSIKADVYHLLYTCYKQLKQDKLALEMLENYVYYNDSVLIDKNKITIVREAIQSEFEFKLFNQKVENEKKQAQLKVSQVKRIYTLVFIGFSLLLVILFVARTRINKHRSDRAILLHEIEQLKSKGSPVTALQPATFQLDRNNIEKQIGKELNETDWKVLNILLEDPVIANKTLAEKAFMSVDGIGSSLRRMYTAFDIKESKYMKISLLMEAIKLSTKAT